MDVNGPFFSLQNLSQQQWPGWKMVFKADSFLKAFYSKSLSLDRRLQYRPKLLIKEMGLALLGLCRTLLCVFFPSRNCLLPNLFTAKVLLEGWPCLFCHIFFLMMLRYKWIWITRFQHVIPLSVGNTGNVILHHSLLVSWNAINPLDKQRLNHYDSLLCPFC